MILIEGNVPKEEISLGFFKGKKIIEYIDDKPWDCLKYYASHRIVSTYDRKGNLISRVKEENPNLEVTSRIIDGISDNQEKMKKKIIERYGEL